MVSFDAEGVRIDIDPRSLRERVSDVDALSRWCDEHTDDPRAVSLLRMLGRLDEADAVGRRSLAEPGLHPVARAVRRARWAQVLQWQGRFDEAEDEFARAAEETGLGEDPTAPSSLLALAAVMHHRGTCRFEHALVAEAGGRPQRAHGLRESALEDARRALALRERCGGSPDDVGSSRMLVDRLGAELGHRS